MYIAEKIYPFSYLEVNQQKGKFAYKYYVYEDGEMKLELLEFDVKYDGGYIGDHPHRGAKNKPREKVSITEKSLKEMASTLPTGKRSNISPKRLARA